MCPIVATSNSEQSIARATQSRHPSEVKVCHTGVISKMFYCSRSVSLLTVVLDFTLEICLQHWIEIVQEDNITCTAVLTDDEF